MDPDLLLSVPILAVWILLALAVGWYAEQRGLNQWTYVLAALVLSPIVGFLLAAVSKPNPAKVAHASGLKKCPECAEWVQPDAKKCRYCGYHFPSVV